MKYLLIALCFLLAFSCRKNEEPCPELFYNDITIPNIRVLAFIDKDSANLLETHQVDTMDITIRDDRGIIQRLHPFLDSTFTKVRYLNLPLSAKTGNNVLIVSVKGKTNSINYKYTVDKQRCYTNQLYDDFKLNGKTYQFKTEQDYFMYGTVTQHQKVNINISPMYIVL